MGAIGLGLVDSVFAGETGSPVIAVSGSVCVNRASDRTCGVCHACSRASREKRCEFEESLGHSGAPRAL